MSHFPGQGYHGSQHHHGGGNPYQGYQGYQGQPGYQGYQQGGYYQGGYQQYHHPPPPGPPPPGPPPPGSRPPPGPPPPDSRPPPGPPPPGSRPPPGPPPPGPHPSGWGPDPRYGGGGGYQQGRPPYGAPPPQHPPPSGLDAYGHPMQQAPHAARHARSGPPPPTTPQHFGHGAPSGYTFQYSNCTGRRKALLIGINYFGQQAELRGCINDVHNVSAFLVEGYGYKREDMVILTDDQSNPVMQPTKGNIIRAMGWLVKDAQPNDSLFLHYSGHGGQTKDLDGDEDDGYDECIYPVDHQTEGHIVDDEIHHYTVKPLQPGVRLTAIFDSCHSATAMDLPYVYSTKGVLKEPNLAKEAGMGLFDAVSAYAAGDLGKVASSVFKFAKTAYKGDDAYEKTKQTRTSPADVIMWSGSKDDQTSADATINAQATGAMSYAFIKALKANPQQSYVELLNSIREVLEGKYSQKPQLSSSHPLDTNLLFVM